MKDAANYLAVDLGASSGRAMLVRFDGERFHPTEVHRFDNGALEIGDGLFWDANRLFEEIKTGIRACTGHRLSAIGIDTWGVDFALLDETGAVLAPPRHYRDPRNVPAMAEAHRRVSRDRIYASTGIQFMPLNSLYQLFAESGAPEGHLVAAAHLLFMPDLFNYWLTGHMATEPTIASTSQAMNALTRQWDHELLAALGLRPEIMPAIRPTGSLCGPLRASIARDVGQPQTPVVLTAGHDTAAAVAAVPASGSEWAFISSGTWSPLGLELRTPQVDAASQAANFTNEAGVAGTVRFLKNIAGLWLVQECRRWWSETNASWSFEQLEALAGSAEPLRSLIDPDDPRFAPPGNMPERIRDACRERGEPVPDAEAALIRCILDSLALRSDQIMRTAARLTGSTIRTVHIVGGGSRNELLNRLIAAAADREVITGPAEATALGNAAVQAVAVGDLPDVGAARRVIAASIDIGKHEPPQSAAEREMWAAARGRFAEMTAARRTSC